VPVAFVEATLSYLSRPVSAMVQLQLLCGMRPGEVCILRTIDLDMTGPVWLYRPKVHKTLWRGHQRIVMIGPRGQEIIREFFKSDLYGYLFSPQDAVAWQQAEK